MSSTVTNESGPNNNNNVGGGGGGDDMGQKISGCLDFGLQRTVALNEYYHTHNCEICLCSPTQRMCKQISCALPDSCPGYLQKDPKLCCDICVPVLVERGGSKEGINLKLGIGTVTLFILLFLLMFAFNRLRKKRTLNRCLFWSSPSNNNRRCSGNGGSGRDDSDGGAGGGGHMSMYSVNTTSLSVDTQNSVVCVDGYAFPEAPPPYPNRTVDRATSPILASLPPSASVGAAAGTAQQPGATVQISPIGQIGGVDGAGVAGGPAPILIAAGNGPPPPYPSTEEEEESNVNNDDGRRRRLDNETNAVMDGDDLDDEDDDDSACMSSSADDLDSISSESTGSWCSQCGSSDDDDLDDDDESVSLSVCDLEYPTESDVPGPSSTRNRDEPNNNQQSGGGRTRHDGNDKGTLGKRSKRKLKKLGGVFFHRKSKCTRRGATNVSDPGPLPIITSQNDHSAVSNSNNSASSAGGYHRGGENRSVRNELSSSSGHAPPGTLSPFIPQSSSLAAATSSNTSHQPSLSAVHRLGSPSSSLHNTNNNSHLILNRPQLPSPPTPNAVPVLPATPPPPASSILSSPNHNNPHRRIPREQQQTDATNRRHS